MVSPIAEGHVVVQAEHGDLRKETVDWLCHVVLGATDRAFRETAAGGRSLHADGLLTDVRGADLFSGSEHAGW
jgi:hypothetical protein